MRKGVPGVGTKADPTTLPPDEVFFSPYKVGFGPYKGTKELK